MITPLIVVSSISGLYASASSPSSDVCISRLLNTKYCGSDASKAAVVFSVAIPFSVIV